LRFGGVRALPQARVEHDIRARALMCFGRRGTRSFDRYLRCRARDAARRIDSLSEGYELAVPVLRRGACASGAEIEPRPMPERTSSCRTQHDERADIAAALRSGLRARPFAHAKLATRTTRSVPPRSAHLCARPLRQSDRGTDDDLANRHLPPHRQRARSRRCWGLPCPDAGDRRSDRCQQVP